MSHIDNGSGDAVTRPVALPGGGECTKIAITEFTAAPVPVRPEVETTFSWTVLLDPPTSGLTSRSIRFDGEPEIELDKDARSFARTFSATGARTATLTVRRGSCVKTRELSSVVCADLAIEPADLPDGTVQSPYSATLTSSAGTPPLSFALLSGTLPRGLTLSPLGSISGVPAEAGTSRFTIGVTDANGCTGSREYEVRVDCPTLRISPASLPGGTVGTAYGVEMGVGGGSGVGTWSAEGLPPGLSISADGKISGTPTLAGSCPVTLRYSDASGCRASSSYTLVVCNVLAISPASLPGATADVAYGAVTFTAPSATGTATWSVSAGSLPTGMSLDGTTGTLSGTPTVVSSFPLTVRATDSLGCQGTADYTLVVACPTITVNPPSLTAALEDVPFSATFTQAGPGVGATYAVAGGALPAGLTLDSVTGVLSGTVAVPGATPFTVRATNPVTGCFGERAYTFTVTPVNDAPSFTRGADVTVLEDSGPYAAAWATALSAGPADEAGQALSFAVTGNTNAALFAVVPAVSPTGVLTFTPAPNASGAATITLTLSDSGGTANGGVDTSTAQTFVVTVTDVNDVPSFAMGADQTVLEDAGTQTVVGWATAISPGPPSEAGQTLTFSVTGNTNPSLFSAAPAIAANGTLTFTPAANENGTATITVTLSDSGGTANGGVDTSSSQQFVVTVTAANDPPVATGRANLPAQVGIPITYPAGTLGGTDVANEVAAGSVVSIVTTPDTLCTGCQLTIGADGSFVFTPPPSAAGMPVSFTYHVADTGSPGPGVSGSAATVSFAVAGPAIYFVKNPAVGAASCTLGNECSLSAALTAIGASTNARIFIGDASTHSPGVGVGLNSGGWIIGQGVPGASFDALFGISLPAQGGLAARPLINQTRPTVSGAPATVTAHASSAIRGFNLNVSGGANKGITANGRSGVVVSDVNVTSASGGAVDLTNTSASFDNIVVVAPSGAGFKATGGGTVTVTGAANTITTTTGTALHVANTTIGAAGLTFRSISSNGGSSTGIILDTTGSSGGLNVTGTGSAGSGGTIANKTGADGSTTTGVGIYLNNTSNVSLAWMQLNDFANSGIVGRSVTGFTLANSVLNGAIGSTSALVEGPIMFGLTNPGGANGLLGTGLIRDTKVSGGVEHNVEFYNQTGTMNLTIEGTTAPGTISGACEIRSNSVASGSDGILMEMQGTATANVTIRRCFFDDNKSQAVQAAAIDSSAIDVRIEDSVVRRTAQGNDGFILSNGSNGDLTAHVTGNNISGFGGVSIFVGQTPGNATAASSLTAVISGNTVTAPATATNHAILSFLTSTVGQVVPANILIDSNTVTQNSTSGTVRAILVDTPDASTSPAFTATVTNNSTFVGDSVSGVAPIVVQARQASAGCFDVRNNTASFPSGTPVGVFGIRVRQANTATANLEQGISQSTVAATVLDENHPPPTTTEVIGTVNVVGNNTCSPPPS